MFTATVRGGPLPDPKYTAHAPRDHPLLAAATSLRGCATPDDDNAG